ncbi:MAG: hypothetical protein PF630_11220 [Gammaproteobacteria bacterium]|nr:hypothetical protein [Gammaproteobacteria bacterium]
MHVAPESSKSGPRVAIRTRAIIVARIMLVIGQTQPQLQQARDQIDHEPAISMDNLPAVI